MARETAEREGGGGEEHRCQEACGVRMRRVRMRRCGVRMRRVQTFCLFEEELEPKSAVDRIDKDQRPSSEKKNKKVRFGKSGVRHMGETGGWAKEIPGIRFSLKSAYMTKNLSECEQRSQNWLSFPSAEL